MGRQQEVLVILHEANSDLLGQIRSVGRVVQVASPRMMTVLVETKQMAALNDLQGVDAVFAGAIPTAARATFNRTERVFSDAWQQRIATQETTSERIGDGLRWDAVGFRAPDLPK